MNEQHRCGPRRPQDRIQPAAAALLSSSCSPVSCCCLPQLPPLPLPSEPPGSMFRFLDSSPDSGDTLQLNKLLELLRANEHALANIIASLRQKAGLDSTYARAFNSLSSRFIRRSSAPTPHGPVSQLQALAESIVTLPLSLSTDPETGPDSFDHEVIQELVSAKNQVSADIDTLQKHISKLSYELTTTRRHVSKLHGEYVRSIDHLEKELSKNTVSLKIVSFKMKVDQADTSYRHAIVAAELKRLEIKDSWEKIRLASWNFESCQLQRIEPAIQKLEKFVAPTEEPNWSTFQSEVADLRANVEQQREAFCKVFDQYCPPPRAFVLHDFKLQPLPAPCFKIEISSSLCSKTDMVPDILRGCIEAIEAKGLETEGIYRIPGSKKQIESMIWQLEHGLDCAELKSPDHDIHAIAGTVKQYLRELPNPLFAFIDKPSEDWPTISAGQMERVGRYNDSDLETKLINLRTSISYLPAVYRATLRYTLQHLKRVSNRSSENKMTVDNVATIFADDIIRDPFADKEVHPSQAGPDRGVPVTQDDQLSIIRNIVAYGQLQDQVIADLIRLQDQLF
ncbi:uncharacterized protein BJ171DRAFT_515607 [Polychytrium aggregatum]|uniref:uncharacterized protein n=1 Tax=Polychytrium aggregatum TaxID=110093 RepID=UPI0022FE1381|nr:uncharacterized protein BJ171DRAFT_515607 [Polychytrium aggregatum]KAI9202070.1 hypothetical protein BJ171DRAFT_515607 [Polychytrium aggregatum]